MGGCRSYIDQKSLDWLSNGATGSAAVGSLSLGWAFWADQLWMLPLTLALSCAAWLLFWFLKSALERGLAADRWSNETRSAVKQRTGKMTIWLLPLWILILIVQFVRILGFHRGHSTPMVWVPIWMFSQAAAAITRMLSPATPSKGPMGLFADMKPVQSEHWGERMTQS